MSTARSSTTTASTRFTRSRARGAAEKPSTDLRRPGSPSPGLAPALLEPAREALHLSVASVEAVDDLKQDLVLVHQMVHQGLQLLLGLHVELVVVLRAQPVSVGEAVERHQDH